MRLRCGLRGMRGSQHAIGEARAGRRHGQRRQLRLQRTHGVALQGAVLAAAQVLGQGIERDVVRFSVMFGLRDVDWIVRRGLDGLRGDEDVQLGLEGGLVVGRSVPALGDDDLSVAAQVYAAAAAQAAARGAGE